MMMMTMMLMISWFDAWICWKVLTTWYISVLWGRIFGVHSSFKKQMDRILLLVNFPAFTCVDPWYFFTYLCLMILFGAQSLSLVLQKKASENSSFINTAEVSERIPSLKLTESLKIDGWRTWFISFCGHGLFSFFSISNMLVSGGFF